MVAQHFRWDFIGLSTDQKPTPATSEKVVDGSTFYCSDNSKLYVYCKNNWYERKPLGSGGGGTTYTAGTGIDITEDTISIDEEVVATLEELNARIAKGEGTPTTATEGVVGGLYEDNTNGKLYICTAITEGTDPDPDTYTWEEVGAGGGGVGAVTTLTADDYNYPVNDPNPYAIGLGLLPAGFYKLANDNIYITRNTTVKGNKTELFYVSDADSQGWTYIWEFQTKNDINSGIKYMVTRYQAVSETGVVVSTYTDNLVSSKYLEAFNSVKVDTSAPTTATEGYIGRIFVDSVTQKGYLCTSASGGTYTWKEITLS